ncbi:F0F1 ATP synthase subunit delta [Propionicicella superfundia]|uniref:F0F1 ATP synthase subunit delta n=1 Tax=Propionicicella superfundia TaxID=348582 RepID=UPI00041C51A1|nr:F0F1 ATP synthase subunit delta [Propionicicella superfundia]
MNETQTARLRELDGAANAAGADPRLADDLFALVEVIEAEPALRRHLSDPSSPEQSRRQLIDGLFGGRVGRGALAVLVAASSLRWGDGETLAGALERQAIRAIMADADEAGRLDDLEDQLFGVLLTVRGSTELSAALADRSRSLADRRALLRGLLADRVLPVVGTLAERAVAARRRTFELTVEGYLGLAAAQRERGIAHVRVAKPLSEVQYARLRAALTAQAGRPLTLEVTVDPDVLGGVRVTIGDEVIEGTVSSRLEAARRAFT